MMNEYYELKPAVAAEAMYHSENIPKEYVGNPLIEALPDLISDGDVIRILREKPDFLASERDDPDFKRMHYIQRLTWQFFQPMDQHLRIWQYLSLNLRQGYVQRNPLLRDSTILINELYAAAAEGREPKFKQSRISIPKGLAIIGVSGVGKSTSLERMLQMFPQVIQHHTYKGKELEMKQIVWVKLDCAHNGSERGFCLSFLNQIDNLVGTRYFEAYEKRATVDTLLTVMHRIASAYSLGIVCVDEIQHLANARNETGKLLNFFVTMENMIGVPIILMGTPSALPLFQGEFRQARRVCSNGSILWKPLQWDKSISNSEWELFLSRMWKYQWIRYPTELSASIVMKMFEETQGIEALAVILFVLLQENAIRTKQETIHVDDIHSVATRDMQIVQPMLDALRSKDESRIARYQDVFSGFLSSFFSERACQHEEQSSRTGPMKQLFELLTDLKIRPELAEKYAEKAIQLLPGEDISLLAMKALELHRQDAGMDKATASTGSNKTGDSET